MRELTQMLWIGCGGAVGAVLRYLAVSGTHQAYKGTFPLGILLVNVVGSFIFGIFAALDGRMDEQVRKAITIGILGALTTFSSFAMDTAEQRWTLAALNIGLNVTLAISAALAGRALMRAVI